MKQKFLLVSLLLTLVLSLSSCGTKERSLYSWDNYEKLTYNYYKSPDPNLEVKMMKMYDKIIDRQKGLRGVVPPGMCAEYGVILVNTGKTERGMKLLEKEMELYPESKAYVKRIIKRLK